VSEGLAARFARHGLSANQAGHIPSCCVTCERGWVLPIADGCGWPLLLLSPLLSGALKKRMPGRDQGVRVVGLYPSFEASHDWLVGHDARAARRHQPGGRNRGDLDLNRSGPVPATRTQDRG
jgi:hypothetical protein